MTISVLLVDDHTILRHGVHALLEAEPDIEIVGEASSASEAVEGALAKRPDVVVSDLSMPGGGSLGAIERIVAECPQTRVIVMTVHDDDCSLRSALAAGASGYLVKRTNEQELAEAIRVVNSGQRFIDRTLETAAPSESLRVLSQREREVVRLLANGYTNREASERLNISVKSVETYRARVVQKLGLRRRADLVRYAVDTGLLTSNTAPISQAV